MLTPSALARDNPDLSPRKVRFLLLLSVCMGVSFLVFLFTGYTALYWVWVRSNLPLALPYLPWARNSSAVALVAASFALIVLFAQKLFPLSPKTRLALSLLTSIVIGFYAEFRNEGKFFLKGLHHFFGPTTWVHALLHRLSPSLGEFLYRMEYSHWNDFLMGPAIVCVLFPIAAGRLYRAPGDSHPVSLTSPGPVLSTGAEQALRFARILMYVGLFWFFFMSWAEKAGYLANPHSSDELDLPFEFGGTLLGFWMARVFTRPFEPPSEKFRSTLLIDFLSSGAIGLLYTLIVSPLSESVTRSVAHALYPVVPQILEVHEYTPLQRHLRPLELLLLAVTTWWCLNFSVKSEPATQLRIGDSAVEDEPAWSAPLALARVLAVFAGYLAILATMFLLLQPLEPAWALTIAITGTLCGLALFFFFRRSGRKDPPSLPHREDGSLPRSR